MLPILHLNRYKIVNPCFLARIPQDELQKFFEGMGYAPYFVEGHEPESVHQELAAALDSALAFIKRIQTDARNNGNLKRPAWPMIVFRTPKGDLPERVRRQEVRGLLAIAPGSDGRHGQTRAHPHPRGLELPARGAFRRQRQFKPELVSLAPKGHRRMSDNPHANGGLLLRDLRLPDFQDYAVDVPSPGSVMVESARTMGNICATS